MKPAKKVVTLVGVPYSGRSTVAKYLAKNHNYNLLSIKSPIVEAMSCLGLTQDRPDDEQDPWFIFNDYRDFTEDYRDFTEFGFKEMFGDDFLLRELKRRIETANSNVVIDDVTNESDVLFLKRHCNSSIIKLVRPSFENNSYPPVMTFDYCVVNDKSKQELLSVIRNLVE